MGKLNLFLDVITHNSGGCADFFFEKFSGVFSFGFLIMVNADADHYNDKYYGEVRNVASGAGEGGSSQKYQNQEGF